MTVAVGVVLGQGRIFLQTSGTLGWGGIAAGVGFWKACRGGYSGLKKSRRSGAVKSMPVLLLGYSAAKKEELGRGWILEGL